MLKYVIAAFVFVTLGSGLFSARGDKEQKVGDTLSSSTSVTTRIVMPHCPKGWELVFRSLDGRTPSPACAWIVDEPLWD